MTLQLPFIAYSIRIGNLDWCKCGHCNNEAREIDCLCWREMGAMLTASAKITQREGSISPCNFMGICRMLVTRVSLIYLVDEFFFVPDVAEQNEEAGWIKSFIFLFLVLIRWNEKGRWVQDFLSSSQKFESFHLDLPRTKRLNLVWLVFVFRGLMLPWVMQVGFYITCTVLGKWNVSRVIPRLYGWVYKILRLFTFVFDHSVVVVTAGSLSRRAQTESSVALWFPLYEICAQNQWVP